MSKTSATTNISRRYRLLFTLPPVWVNLPLSFLIPFLLVLASALPLARSIYIPVALALGMGIEKSMLFKNKIASLKRLSMVSLTSSLFWLLTYLIGAPFSKGQTLLATGMFMAIGYRVIVFRAVFFGDPVRSLFASFFQPFLLLISLLGPSFFTSFSNPLADLFGISFVLYSALYMELIDSKGKKFFGQKPIYLFKTFMMLWICDSPELFESHLEGLSKPKTVETHYIIFDRGFVLVIPGVHPGPLASVGSNNLPYDISNAVKDLGLDAVVAHGISGHDTDLPSRGEVERYLSSMRLEKRFRGEACSHPFYSKRGKITVSGIRFDGAALLTISASPHGIEDFPQRVLEALKRKAEEEGLMLLLIDAHNSGGPEPTDEDCEDAISAGIEVLEALKDAKLERFRVAYKSVRDGFGADVGPLGLSLILIEVGSKRYAYVFADANNAVGGIKEYVSAIFKERGVELVELCTTDTHFNSGKIRNPKGYYYLGEATPKERLGETLLKMLEEAGKELSDGGLWYGSFKSEVRTAGSDVWEGFSKGMDRTFGMAKRLLIPLAGLYFAALISSVI